MFLKFLMLKKVWIPTLFIAIFFGDSIAARTYMSYLCATQAGTFTLNQIELGPEYWNEDGSPRFIDEHGNFTDHSRHLKKAYKRVSASDEVGLGVVRLSTNHVSVEYGDLLLETISYVYRGGWAANNLQPFYVGSSGCERSPKGYFETSDSMADELGVSAVKKIFIKGINND